MCMCVGECMCVMHTHRCLVCQLVHLNQRLDYYLYGWDTQYTEHSMPNKEIQLLWDKTTPAETMDVPSTQNVHQNITSHKTTAMDSLPSRKKCLKWTQSCTRHLSLGLPCLSELTSRNAKHCGASLSDERLTI